MFKVRVVMIFCCVSLSVWADDDGLYEGVAPPGSTFVRIFNADVVGDVSPTISKNDIPDVRACNASSYVFLPEGELDITVAKVKKTFSLGGDNFYTVIYNQGKLTLEKDIYFKNKRKSLVSVYNQVSDSSVDLTVKGGSIKVIENVPFGDRKDREINAVKIEMEVFSEGRQLLKPPAQAFTRGDVYSLLACGSAESTVANWVKWDVQPAS